MEARHPAREGPEGGLPRLPFPGGRGLEGKVTRIMLPVPGEAESAIGRKARHQGQGELVLGRRIGGQGHGVHGTRGRKQAIEDGGEKPSVSRKDCGLSTWKVVAWAKVALSRARRYCRWVVPLRQCPRMNSGGGRG